jgi:transforming growth factor-beta-induced protein
MKLRNGLLAMGAVLLLSSSIVACGDDDEDTDDSAAGRGGSDSDAGEGSGATSSKAGSPSNGGSGPTAGASPVGGEGGGMLRNIVEIAAANDDFSSLVAAVTKAELADELSAEGPLTVFAPTNDAFDALLESLDVTLDDLTEEQLTEILTYHVVSGRLLAADVVEQTYATTLLGADVRIKVDGNSVFLNLTTEVTATDIQASNGVIHVIDQVLLPPGDIPTVAAENAEFSSLVAALTKAELVDTLAGEGPFTVFAPTNAAFEELLDGLGVTLDDLTKEQLTPILTYHVVAGKLYSEDVVKATEATTVQGEDVAIEVSGNNVVLNGDTNVTAVDVLARNGVIHVIDKVLTPPSP